MVSAEKFTCMQEDKVIEGVLCFPEEFDESKKYGVVILSHGFISNYIEAIPYCEYLSEIGYITVCFNFHEGVNMSITSEINELIAVKAYIQSLEYVDVKNIVLMGFSQGGLVSGLTAAQCKDEIAKLIMVYPALCIPDHARRGKLGGGTYDVNDVPETIDCGRIVIGKEFHEDVVDKDVYLELTAYKGPVLILHGTADNLVEYTYSMHAQKMYEEGQCHLQIIENAGHGFNKEERESVCASIKAFLEEKKEILTINIFITDCEGENVEEKFINKVYFTGYCDNELFKGTVVQGGCDTQEYQDEQLISMHAEYTLVGLDSENKKSYIHIVNEKVGDEWKPVLHTNSNVLKWMNETDFTAVLEHYPYGPKVRIFMN